MIEFSSIEQMIEDTRAGGLSLWENIMRSDCEQQGISAEMSFAKMKIGMTM